MAGVCGTFCRGQDFLLQHDRPSDFVHSVLFASPLPYAIVMSCISVHTFTMAIYTGFTSSSKEKIFIWLTYWSYFSLTARFLLTTFNAWSYVFRQRRANGRSAQLGDGAGQKREEECCEMSVLFKAQWVLQSVSSTTGIIVTGLYWNVLYDPNKPESVRSINSHLLNALFVLADVLLSRAPVRIHHFVYSFGFVSLYVLFSLVFWAADGTNDKGDPYIYSLLDYTGRPGRATLVILAVDCVGTPVVHTLLYLLFRLRQWAVGRCRPGEDPAAPPAQDVQVSSLSLGGKSDASRRPSGEKDISLDDAAFEKTPPPPRGVRGRDYTLTSDRDEGDVMIDVDMDFEMDERRGGEVGGGGIPAGERFRPTLQTNSSQVSCTDSTKALLT
ncbi:uncharacterized protein LOC143281880 isoform X2 [Babylonia areolata]|uniref:uncharacterized protein LOC143281880 isoform X2 n=1 Tax=Babylonia areolata TaxID=304850 RepID=UPI003FD13327